MAPDPMRRVVGLLCGLGFIALSVSANEFQPWWSLAPIQSSPSPRSAAGHVRTKVQSPIDQFILAKLEEKGLTPSPMADKRTLLRRVYFDLIGLPPTPEEINAF